MKGSKKILIFDFFNPSLRNRRRLTELTDRNEGTEETY